ncbi:DNA repair protein RadC [Alkalibaculum sp. M08DMB]|uniref:DNA repair protein RadC n=1 Tax=Alkalibaculum sporogenes TaxID=2655001 RepID=A0A6A7K675_9FIRM|nr:DNA repair protein RadC [Alkalibaculum sporogenes]MPW24841.1 DNA repair protein RadC [Alkalibaculum sporogenes]
MMNNIYKHIPIPELPIDEQPRYKMTNLGCEVLSNAELFAILIGTGNKEETAVQLSQRILKCCDNDLSYFVNASIEQLSNSRELKGIGAVKACKIKAAFEIGRRLNKQIKTYTKVRSPKDIADLLMQDMKYLNQEYFKIILLDTKNQITSIETVTIGTLNASLVHPREVFRIAINKSSSSIIIVHNHPSGDPCPSEEDKRITNRLLDAGEIIGIKLLDHLIIGYDNYVSFKELGLL